MEHGSEPGLLETFATFQAKLHALQEAAARVLAAQQRQAEDTEEAFPDIAAGAIAASKEQCRTMVVETQELARKLSKPQLKRMADMLAQQYQECVST